MISLTTGVADQTARTGGPVWRKTMARLYDYYRRDMSDAALQRKALYPKNWDKHVLRTVPFVWAMSRELATAYLQDPSRTWVGLDGQPLPEATAAMIGEQYKRARVNGFMRQAQRQLVAMNNATIWVWPDASRTGVSLTLPPPHEQDVALASPFGASEADVAAWWLRIALPSPEDPQTAYYGIIKATRAELYWTEAPGDKTGKGVINPSTRANPFGDIPAVIIRGTDPAPSEFWAAAPDDQLQAQRALNHDLTDVGTIARLQGYGQPVLKSMTAGQKEIELGPETVVGVQGEGADFTFASPNPQLEGYIKSLQEYVQQVVAMNGLNPATFMKSAGITALAKQIELVDRENYRKEHLEIMRRAEQRLYDVMRLVMNFLMGREVWPPAVVEIEYRNPTMPVDPLSDANATKALIELDQTGRVRARALRDGITMVEALKRILDDRKADAELAATELASTPVETETSAPAEVDAPDMAAAPQSLDAVPGDVQGAALNGAQVQALQSVVQAVASGQLPADAAREIILAAFPIDPAAVDKMLASLNSFEPAAAA